VSPVRIVGGAGSFGSVADLVPAAGRVLLVTTPGSTARGRTSAIVEQIGVRRVTVHDAVTPNPSLDDLDEATERLREGPPQSIVAVGGGSALDAAKVLSVTLVCGVEQPLERILRGGLRQSWAVGVPVVAVPTTAGTGAEVTPFATVWDTVTHRKHSVAASAVHPSVAVLDPELTLSLPPEETLVSGLDAISHALESLWNRNRTAVSVAYARQALALAVTALPAVGRDPLDLGERARMQEAALLAGLAISQTRTAIAHSVSYPLTARFGVPHGLACSFTLRELLEPNLDALVELTADGQVLEAILDLLEGLGLGERVRRYVSAQEVLAFESEMHTPERLSNFDGRLEGGIPDLIARSLA
jgi:alcohol dehydrogenase